MTIKLDIHSQSLPDIKPNQIFQFEIKDIDNDQLQSFALKLEQKEDSGLYSNVGGWHSPQTLFRVNHEDVICELQDRINTCAEKILKRKVNIRHAWININRKGNSNRNHKHPYALAACYYVTDSYSGGEFVCTETSTKIQPKSGMLLMFPGDLYHQVLPYQGDDTRISIACNIF